MTTQNNSAPSQEQQQQLLSLWEDLSKRDRKVALRFLNHLCSISLELRSRRAWMEAQGVVDHAKMTIRA